MIWSVILLAARLLLRVKSMACSWQLSNLIQICERLEGRALEYDLRGIDWL